VAEAVFWGLWWPGVILSMMVFGQVWCGVLCPDGTIILAVALGLGTAVAALLWLAAGRGGWMRLAYALIPLAGLGLFLGAVEHSLALLGRLDLLVWLRAVLVALGLAWSGRLGWLLTTGARARAVFALLLAGLAALYLLV
jgi:hypothetical protein